MCIRDSAGQRVDQAQARVHNRCSRCSVSYTHLDVYKRQIVENTLIPDARQLLQSAYDLMASMDGSSQAYLNIQSAASNLETVITSSNPSTADVAAAMAMLTQAMAGGF